MAWIDHKPVGSGDTCEKCDAPRDRHRVDHVADGEPCVKCGLPGRQHRNAEYVQRKNARKEHIADADPCTSCGLPASQHRTIGYIERKYGANTRIQEVPTDISRVEPSKPKEKAEKKQVEKRERKVAATTQYIGVDGEGQGR